MQTSFIGVDVSKSELVIPVTQAPPASHAGAVVQGLGEVFPWDSGLQYEQNAVEGSLIAHGELASTTFGGRCECGNQRLQLSPQFFANGLSGHEGMKHKCFVRVSDGVVLAALCMAMPPLGHCLALAARAVGMVYDWKAKNARDSHTAVIIPFKLMASAANAPAVSLI